MRASYWVCDWGRVPVADKTSTMTTAAIAPPSPPSAANFQFSVINPLYAILLAAARLRPRRGKNIVRALPICRALGEPFGSDHREMGRAFPVAALIVKFGGG